MNNMEVEPEAKKNPISMLPLVSSSTWSDIYNITHKTIIHIAIKNKDKFWRLQMQIRISPSITSSYVQDITEYIVLDEMRE